MTDAGTDPDRHPHRPDPPPAHSLFGRPSPQALQRGLAVATLVLAALAQVRVWASGRGLWHDELAIALNLRGRGYPELAGGLNFNQVAPYGWLATEKLTLDWLGRHELLLRLPSLVAGLVLLLLCALVARRAVGRWATVVALVLVGFAPWILYFSGELKQYAVEAAVALGLLVLGDEFARRTGAGARPPRSFVALWALLVAFALTMSYSALIVLAGVVGGLTVMFAGRGRWPTVITLWVAAAPGAVLGGALALYRRSQPMAAGQETFFVGGMPPRDGGVAGLLHWLPVMWTRFVENPLHWAGASGTLLLLLTGLVALVARRRYAWAAMFAGVLSLAVMAAALRGLPLASRVALYLVAPVILLVVAGLDGVARGVKRLGERAARSRPAPRSRVAVIATAVLAALVPAGALARAAPGIDRAVEEAATPRNRDLSREAIMDLGGRLRPGDVVLVYWASDRVVRWYGPDAGVRRAEPVHLVPVDDPRCRPDSVDAPLAGASRVWYLHGRRMTREPEGYTAWVTRGLARRGRVIDARTFGPDVGGPPDLGAFSTAPGWVLVDLAADPDPAADLSVPDLAPDLRYGCLTAVPR